jgi:uncharacterized protein YbjT (DUF2867 family)
MSILVTGATGNVGSRLVRRLVGAGHKVRAFARSGEKAKFEGDVEIVTGDFDDKDSVRRALDGVTKMFLLSPAIDLERHDANAIDAAKEAGVQLVVKQSVMGAPAKATHIPRWHRAGEERLEASGIPYVFLRPSSFMSNTLGWVGSIKASGTVYNPLGAAALPVVHPDDIADVAAAALTQPGHANKAYEVTGPEAMTTQDGMLKGGTPPAYVEARAGLVQFLRGLGRVEPSPAVKNVTGNPPRTFRSWVEANIGAFK